MQEETNFLFSYPETAGIKKLILEATSSQNILSFDFQDGIVRLPDTTTENLNKKLKNLNKKLRNLSFNSGEDVTLYFGVENSGIFCKANIWHHFSNVEYDKLVFRFYSLQFPLNVEFALIAGTSRKLNYKTDNKITKFHALTSQTSTNTNALFLHVNSDGYTHHTIALNASTNDMTYSILGLLDDSGVIAGTSDYVFTEIQGDTAITATTDDIVQIEGAFKRIIVYIKSSVADTHGVMGGSYTGCN